MEELLLLVMKLRQSREIAVEVTRREPIPKRRTNLGRMAMAQCALITQRIVHIRNPAMKIAAGRERGKAILALAWKPRYQSDIE